MRLFVAIELPNDIRAAFATVLKELRDVSPHTKWVRPANLHLTLKFLGDTGTDKLSALQSALATIRFAQPVTLEFRGLGSFPNAKHPRVFCAGIQNSPSLAAIVSEIDKAVHALGFPLENRLFNPHLTLARFNQPSVPAALQAAAIQNAARSFDSFTVREFHLIESKLKSSGAEYTTIRTFLFAPEA